MQEEDSLRRQVVRLVNGLEERVHRIAERAAELCGGEEGSSGGGGSSSSSEGSRGNSGEWAAMVAAGKLALLTAESHRLKFILADARQVLSRHRLG